MWKKTVILLALGLSAVGSDWLYLHEYEDILSRLRATPGLTIETSGGNEDVTFEDIYANVRLADGTRLSLNQLSTAAFDGEEPFYVSRVGDWEPRITSWGYFEVTKDGAPVKSVSWRSLDMGPSPHAFCCRRFRSVPDVLSSVHALQRELEAWPRCPAFARQTAPNGTIHRYCIARADTESWYPPAP